MIFKCIQVVFFLFVLRKCAVPFKEGYGLPLVVTVIDIGRAINHEY